MKIISIIAFIMAFAFGCNGQENKIPPYKKTDTGRVDSAQVEKINEMPMDSTHKVFPSPPDTTQPRPKGDDEDPKRVDPKRREY